MPEVTGIIHYLRVVDYIQGVYVVQNPVECTDFSHLLGESVIINRELRKVAKIERFAHCPPWREGELIGVLLEPKEEDT